MFTVMPDLCSSTCFAFLSALWWLRISSFTLTPGNHEDLNQRQFPPQKLMLASAQGSYILFALHWTSLMVSGFIMRILYLISPFYLASPNTAYRFYCYWDICPMGNLPTTIFFVYVLHIHIYMILHTCRHMCVHACRGPRLMESSSITLSPCSLRQVDSINPRTRWYS